MDEQQVTALAAWVTQAGLVGKPETAMIAGFCERAVAAGLPLSRVLVIIDTLHPIHEGRAYRWEHGKTDVTVTEYGRTNEGQAAENWRRTVFYRVLESGAPSGRWRITPEAAAEFPSLAELRDAGMTDYLVLINRFAAGAIIGEMDCVYSSWATDAASGFSDEQLAVLQRLVPFLALAVKSASLARIAGTLVETYLGRDAGRRVLSGRIARGVAERIDTVLWFSDLRGYTKITDTADPTHIIPLLNDYADVVISAVHAQGGDVLKLIGDGTLAIFPAESRGPACERALAAAIAARHGVAELNQRRSAEERPTTDMYLGLHVGEVFYGNIGSTERLDFTVVGPAVNEVSRIAALCRSVDQPLLVSAAFADALPEKDRRLVSVGRYALRGVGRPQDLFTLDPDAAV
jgi:adenylate cyclase